MAELVRVEGLSELEDALLDLPKGLQRGVLQRVLKKAAQPIVAAARAKAPVDQDPADTPRRRPGTLRDSLHDGTKLNARQRRFAKAEGKSYAERYVGTSDPAGVPQEFGTFSNVAQPFLGPAWDEEKGMALEIVKTELGGEISRTAERAAKRAARLAAGG